MNRTKYFFVGVVGSALMLSGCIFSSTTPGGCETDDDCSGSQVCGPGGTCTAPSDTGGTGGDTGLPGDAPGDTDGSDADTGGGDTGPPPDDSGAHDDGGHPDGDTQGTDLPSTTYYYFTSGGGTGMSTDYSIQVRVGAPSPAFDGKSDNYRLQLAPVRP